MAAATVRAGERSAGPGVLRRVANGAALRPRPRLAPRGQGAGGSILPTVHQEQLNVAYVVSERSARKAALKLECRWRRL